jgi:argininosuccinate lyase
MRQWGGRFSGVPSDALLGFSESLSQDSRLWEYDIAGSQAHVRMLGKQGILSKDEVDSLLGGLEQVRANYARGEVPNDISLEDIHTAVEWSLRQIVGDLAGKVHMGRSRNDQVALDMHLWCRDAARQLVAAVRDLQEQFVRQAEAHKETVMPGYTHLQRAQPVLLAHHLLSYFFMLERDVRRLRAVAESAGVSPLGAAALAGSTFNLDPVFTASELGLPGVYENSMDAVSDRDYLLEMCFACSVIMAHLSRLGEEIVLWTSAEFGFASLPDSLTTGSSIMPQKKNADPAELIRGRSGRVFGSLMGLLTVIKGLPMAYCRDLQEDKELVFGAFDATLACVRMAALLVEGLRFDLAALERAVSDWLLTATDVADALARRGMPFREAHGIVGALVSRCLQAGFRPDELSAEDLARISPHLTQDLLALLDPVRSVRSRDYPMATGPESVEHQIALARSILAVDGGVRKTPGPHGA